MACLVAWAASPSRAARNLKHPEAYPRKNGRIGSFLRDGLTTATRASSLHASGAWETDGTSHNSPSSLVSPLTPSFTPLPLTFLTAPCSPPMARPPPRRPLTRIIAGSNNVHDRWVASLTNSGIDLLAAIRAPSPFCTGPLVMPMRCRPLQLRIVVLGSVALSEGDIGCAATRNPSGRRFFF